MDLKELGNGIFVLIVSFHHRTAITCVLLWSSLNITVLVNEGEVWQIMFSNNYSYCHACHTTRFAIFFLPPSYIISTDNTFSPKKNNFFLHIAVLFFCRKALQIPLPHLTQCYKSRKTSSYTYKFTSPLKVRWGEDEIDRHVLSRL